MVSDRTSLEGLGVLQAWSLTATGTSGSSFLLRILPNCINNHSKRMIIMRPCWRWGPYRDDQVITKSAAWLVSLQRGDLDTVQLAQRDDHVTPEPADQGEGPGAAPSFTASGKTSLQLLPWPSTLRTAPQGLSPKPPICGALFRPP